MGVKELFSAIARLLFSNGRFWRELKESVPPEDANVMREYAVPVIAMVQLLKFPLIGQPRPAMYFSIANFLIDVAALFVLSGGTLSLLEPDKRERFQESVSSVVCYAMTPVWLGELLYFIPGSWNLLFAAVAICCTLLIGRNGLKITFEGELVLSASALRNVAIYFVAVNSASLFLIRSMIRLFNF
ncbi:MAG: hypothetical protein WCH05_08365 [Chlorobiaceae bacterium]